MIIRRHTNFYERLKLKSLCKFHRGGWVLALMGLLAVATQSLIGDPLKEIQWVLTSR